MFASFLSVKKGTHRNRAQHKRFMWININWLVVQVVSFKLFMLRVSWFINDLELFVPLKVFYVIISKNYRGYLLWYQHILPCKRTDSDKQVLLEQELERSLDYVIQRTIISDTKRPYHNLSDFWHHEDYIYCKWHEKEALQVNSLTLPIRVSDNYIITK